MAFVVLFSLLEGISMRNIVSEIKSWNTIKKKRNMDTSQYECYSELSSFLPSKGHATHIKCARPRKTVTYKKAATLRCSAEIRGNLVVFKTENPFQPYQSPYISQVCKDSQVFSIQICHFHFC